MSEGIYKVQYGQNIFDVCLSIYGSLEGLLDLMVSNPGLSIDTKLSYGDELAYTPYYTEDDAVLRSFDANSTIPANGIGDIVYEDIKEPFMMIIVPANAKGVSFNVAGSGDLIVDWGDGVGFERYQLSEQSVTIEHTYSGSSKSNHYVRLSGDVILRYLDVTGMELIDLFIGSSVHVENFRAVDSDNLSLTLIPLLEGTETLLLSGSKLQSLVSLVDCHSLSDVDVSNCGFSTEEIDNYLIELVKNYDERIACTINLSGNARPSGTYQEPENLLDPQSGMEAIYVIANYHKEYNGSWAFIIDDKTY